jgi:hypothetical protein
MISVEVCRGSPDSAPPAECLAIHVGNADGQTSWNQDAAAITVQSSIYRGQEQPRLKTQAAYRTVDLDPRLNIQIAEFAAKNSREVGSFLFQSKRGGPMRLKTARNRLHKLHVEGSIAFAVSAQRDFANATYRKTFCVTGLVMVVNRSPIATASWQKMSSFARSGQESRELGSVSIFD